MIGLLLPEDEVGSTKHIEKYRWKIQEDQTKKICSSHCERMTTRKMLMVVRNTAGQLNRVGL